MSNKSIKLSSEGLKNIIPNACNQDNDFQFIFGDQEIRMNTIFAQFISPAVSKIHLSDPTTQKICFNDYIIKNQKKTKINLSNDVISLIQKLSRGYKVEINEEQSYEMRNLAILFENEELFTKINKLYPYDINESNIDYYLQDLQFYHSQLNSQSRSFSAFDYTNIINFIAAHFYLIDEEKLLQLPRKFLYLILTNEHLQLKNEDSLFSFIQKIFLNLDEEEEEEELSDDEDDEKISIISFYETIEFSSLSESKFIEFIENFNSKRMTKLLWKKLYPCFYFNYPHIQKTSKERCKEVSKERYLTKSRQIEYDGNEEHSFEGIIHQLTIESGGNVNDTETVKVTSTPTNGNDVASRFAVDFDDNEHYFQTKNEKKSWIKYDFLDSKVRPSHYTIRTRPTGGKGDNHPKNWVIEGSNTDQDDDWKVLDERHDITILDDSNVTHTYDIQTEIKENESFRYLRLRQTGPNTQNGNYYFLTLSALEYFGVLYSK